MSEQLYLIWSHEHQGWWAPDRAGYVLNARDAGRYSRAEAGDIVVDEVPFGIEVAVPEEAAMMHGTAYVWGMAPRETQVL